MPISLVSRKTYRAYRYLKNYYGSRREAFRAAKRDNSIPVTQHPDKVVLPFTSDGANYNLDDRNVRLYIFNILIGAVGFEYHIREDK